MTTKSPLAVAVPFAALLGCSTTATNTTPTATPATVPTVKIAAAPFDCVAGTPCRVSVTPKFDSNTGKCVPELDRDPLTFPSKVKESIIWEVPEGWVFKRADGAILKDPNGDDEHHQFGNRYPSDYNGAPTPQFRPSRWYHWKNANSHRQDFEYELNFERRDDPQVKCHVDPTIKNQG